ncbi:MAG: glycine--tRNA ligase subunit beta [Candidatus Omnitrophica bacterium]|nr:glycine--tRNA ligase subunit beta [Candidatus Omnitrophota bacterium]
MPNLLVEIGTEELPLASLDVIYSQLEQKVRSVFRENRIAPKEIKVEATPRRIALWITGLPVKQEDQILEITGPSWEKAFNTEGKATTALQGFLKAKNAAEKDVKSRETPKGKFVAIQKKEKGKFMVSLLPSLLTEVFTTLPFPKLMRWEPSGFRFPRPVRWVVALLDQKKVNFELAGLEAEAKSYGHRFLSPKSFPLKKADWKTYESLLKRHHVVLSLEKRKAVIEQALARKYQQKFIDEELVHTTAQLVEEPFILEGKFSKSYLDLPSEVLASCMKKNQKIFACYDLKKRPTGKFVAVMNGKRGALSQIKADYENVLESRLKDARYFYDADTKETLGKKEPLLEQIVYLGKLGTMRDKTARLEKLAQRLCEMTGLGEFQEDLKRAAKLSKIDLVTQLVYEFPDLQGIVGREYALEAGEKESVAKAIGAQYLPKNLSEDFQEVASSMTRLGGLFGVLDRLDLVVGAFGTGLEPTGSQDPFALRRAGGILVKLIRAFRFHFSLSKAVEESASLYGKVISLDFPELKSRLTGFFKERVAFELQTNFQDRSMEIFQAVWEASSDDLADVFERYHVLLELNQKNPEAFLKAAKVVERTANILKGVKESVPEKVDSGLFQHDLEHKLFALFESKSDEIREILQRKDYRKGTLVFGEVFYQTVHDFFETVLVNVEDPGIRLNRHALMKKINRLYAEKTADLSLLTKLEGK